MAQDSHLCNMQSSVEIKAGRSFSVEIAVNVVAVQKFSSDKKSWLSMWCTNKVQLFYSSVLFMFNSTMASRKWVFLIHFLLSSCPCLNLIKATVYNNRVFPQLSFIKWSLEVCFLILCLHCYHLSLYVFNEVEYFHMCYVLYVFNTWN